MAAAHCDDDETYDATDSGEPAVDNEMHTAILYDAQLQRLAAAGFGEG